MSLSSGFFNSVDHDRLYNAEDMSRLFDGLIRDGVFASIGTCMVVKANTKMTVNVGIGRAWFNHTWTLNDAIMPVTLEQSHVLWNRIDAVVIEVNSEENVRQNSIKIVQGEPSTNPVKPTLTKSTLVNQYPLAYITVPAAATEIRQADIENTVGTTECPFVSGILSVISIEELIPQWKDILDRFVEENTANFNTWMNDEKTAYAQWLQSNKDDYNKLVSEQTTSYNTWFDGIKNSYTNWFASIKEAYDANWKTFQQWESTSKSEYNSWFTGVKSTYDTNWAAFQKWEKDAKKDFEDWYEDVQNQLSGDVVAKIYDTIESVERSAMQLVELPLGEIVEGTIEAPIVIESATGTGTLYALSKYLTGGIDDYAYATYKDATYDKTTHTVTFGSQDGSGVYFVLRKNMYHLEKGKKYTLSATLKASAAMSDLTVGVEMGDDHVYQSTLTSGNNKVEIEFTYNGEGKLTFVLYSKAANAGKTVEVDAHFRLSEDSSEAIEVGGPIEITEDTKFPLYALSSADGNTVLAGVDETLTDVTAYCAVKYNAKALLDADKHAMEETVALIGSTDKSIKQTIASPMMITKATTNLLKFDGIYIDTGEDEEDYSVYKTTTTYKGVTFTINADGTFKISGTSESSFDFYIYINSSGLVLEEDCRPRMLPPLSGIYPADFVITDSNGNKYYGENVIPKGIIIVNIGATITAGTTWSGSTFSAWVIKPMLTTDLDATYDDFVPYSGYDVQTCGKNLLNPTLATTTVNGITITNNGTTFDMLGTANNEIDKFLFTCSLIKGKKYVLSFYGDSAKDGIKIYFMNGTTEFMCSLGKEVYFEYVGASNVAKIVHLTIVKDTAIANTLRVWGSLIEIDSLTGGPISSSDINDFVPYESGGTVHIDSKTEFPLLGLNTVDGETNVISPANVETYYAGNEQGKYILEMIYKAANSGGIYYSSTAPKGSFKAGDIWFNSTDLTNIDISVYTGSYWKGASAYDRKGTDVIKSSTKPSRGLETLWIDSGNDNTLKHVDKAGNVTELAAGGVSVGSTAPSNTKLLWIDTGSGGVSKYYNGSAWVATAAVWG